jgi:hypothetical protein
VKHSNERPDPSYLWEKYSYNPFTGKLHRRDNDKELKGNKCGNCHQLSIHGKARHPYAVVVFTWIKARWPIHGMEIDHIDRNPFNQRVNNLREVTRRQNKQNTRRFKGGAVLKNNRWEVSYYKDKKSTYLGSFSTEIEARLAYINKCVTDGEPILPELLEALEAA